jgi:hypothetical protein
MYWDVPGHRWDVGHVGNEMAGREPKITKWSACFQTDEKTIETYWDGPAPPTIIGNGHCDVGLVGNETAGARD